MHIRSCCCSYACGLLDAVAMKWKDVVLEDFDDTIEPSGNRSRQKGRSVTAPSDRFGMKNVGQIPLRLAWSQAEMPEESWQI